MSNHHINNNNNYYYYYYNYYFYFYFLFIFLAHGWTVGVKHYIAGIADGGVLFTEVIKIRKTIYYSNKLRSPSVLPRTIVETSRRFHVCRLL